MPRGRKPDHTIPATRALTLQRDYRARRNEYIADLEARCKAAEEENARLKAELEIARRQAALSPETIRASAQLQGTLEAAAAAVSNFIQVALPLPSSSSYAALLDSLSTLQPASVRPESPCCGGYLDCEGLVEEEGSDQRPSNVSQLRSTSST